MRSGGIAGLGLLALTGAMLFTAEASHVVLNGAFLIKVALIALALLNVAWVEALVVPRIAGLPPLTPLPAPARYAAVASLVLWLAVAICGRAIAYF